MRLAGCSTDSVEAQKAFAEKVGGVRFPLIADADTEIAKAYDVWLEDWKTSARATAVIGEDGVIVKTYPRAPLDGKGHAERVFGDCEELFG